MLSWTNDVGENIKTIFSGSECSEGRVQLVQTFLKDNCKPDIWCRLVPFIWAGVVGVGGGGAQVPLR